MTQRLSLQNTAITIFYFDGSPFPWKLADDFAEDPRWGYPRWKVVLGKLLGKGKAE